LIHAFTIPLEEAQYSSKRIYQSMDILNFAFEVKTRGGEACYSIFPCFVRIVNSTNQAKSLGYQASFPEHTKKARSWLYTLKMNNGPDESVVNLNLIGIFRIKPQ